MKLSDIRKVELEIQVIACGMSRIVLELMSNLKVY